MMLVRQSRQYMAVRSTFLLLAGWLATASPEQTEAPAVAAWQIAAGGKMAFEVASIRPSDPGKFTPPAFPLDAGDAYASTGGRFSADFPLSVYITFAYKLSPTPEQR